MVLVVYGEQMMPSWDFLQMDLHLDEEESFACLK